MRIISGRFKGLSFGTKIFEETRPTTDRMRESIFNALSHYINFEDDNIEVLDMCAGTGALGFEAISRGANRCIFVENQLHIAQEIRHSANSLGIPQHQSPIAVQDALTFFNGFFLKQLPDYVPVYWNCIFCDPPYIARILNKILHEIEKTNSLCSQGILIAEHDIIEHILLPKGFSTLTSLTFGKTIVDIIQKD
jgi:16S rRNA (guanine(966)-N(2))-methyltransferase RsmD